MEERTGIITLGGKPMTLAGHEVRVGEMPDGDSPDISKIIVHHGIHHRIGFISDLIRHVNGAVGDRVGLRISRKRYEKLVAHGQPLIIRLKISQLAILRRS